MPSQIRSLAARGVVIIIIIIISPRCSDSGPTNIFAQSTHVLVHKAAAEGACAYFERLVGDAVGVVGTGSPLVGVVDGEDDERRRGGGGTGCQPRRDHTQAGATRADARLCEQRAADGHVLVDGKQEEGEGAGAER